MTITKRFECTKDNPWKDEYNTDEIYHRPIVHADAKEVGEQEDGYPGGDVVTYKCPYCGKSWETELPQ